MFPVILGVILFVIAVAIVVKSRLETGEPIEVNLRSASVVLVALAVFALMVDPFGIIPALLALLLISSLAVSGRRLSGTVLFAILVTAAIVFIFFYLMNINLELIGWSA